MQMCRAPLETLNLDHLFIYHTMSSTLSPSFASYTSIYVLIDTDIIYMITL